MAYATPEDVAARLGRELDTDEETLVEARLGDVELILKSRIPDLDDKATESAFYEAVVVLVESEAVLRLIRNPDGYTQETDGNYSYTISRAVASGKLEILPEEWSLLGYRASMRVLKPTFEPYPYAGEVADLVPYTEEQAIEDGWA